MGIPSYFSYIIKNHSNIIRNLYFHQNIAKTTFHSVYMDCNSMIYDAFYSIESDAEKQNLIGTGLGKTTMENLIIKLVINKIQSHIRVIAPNNIVYIAFDGVAPFAKMEQQRTRRYKTGFQNAIDFTNPQFEMKLKSNKWNTAAITPGTEFMSLLSKEIEQEFNHRNKYYGVKKLIVSTSMEAGEGEHKMFEYMRNNANRNENIAVYGLDSDLIMLSLFHCFACNNIYIFREAPQFSKSLLPSNIKIKENEPLFLNTRKLVDSIGALMTGFTKVNSDTCRGKIYDYVFMCFMMGNDFLPHFPALNIRNGGIDILVEFYHKYIIGNKQGFINVDTGRIDWKWVKFFIGELAKKEHEFLLEQYSIRKNMSTKKYPDSNPAERAALFENTPILYRSEELYISPHDIGWESRYYKMAFDADMSPELIKDICVNYLEGLEWVFRYYTEGCPHWRWRYKYHYPPLLKDLVQYIPVFDTEFIDSTIGINQPYHPYTQLAYVIPKWNHGLLPKDVQEKLKRMDEYYPDINNLKFQWMFCRYFWEAHIKLPDIPIDKIDHNSTTPVPS